MEAAALQCPVDMGPALKIVQEMSPLSSGDIIPLLQRLQDAYGYLPPAVVLAVCNQTGLPASRVFGVATFYGQFHLEPHGRHTVRELVDVAFRHVGIDDWEQHVVIDPRFYRPAEVDLLIGDATKANTKLGWQPKVDFPSLVKKMVDSDVAWETEKMKLAFHADTTRLAA